MRPHPLEYQVSGSSHIATQKRARLRASFGPTDTFGRMLWLNPQDNPVTKPAPASLTAVVYPLYDTRRLNNMNACDLPIKDLVQIGA